MWQVFAAGPLCMEFARQFIEIEGNPVRLMGRSGSLQQARKERNPLQNGQFSRVIESLQGSSRQESPALRAVLRQVGQHLAGIAKHRISAGMAVLDIEHRVVAGLLDDLGQVEVKNGV